MESVREFSPNVNIYLGESVGVGVAVEGDGGRSRADGDNLRDNLGGVDNGVVGVSNDGGCESKNGGE